MNPVQPPLDGEIHLYRIALPHHTMELSRLEHLLSKSELHRAGLLKNDRTKMRFIAGRGVLRTILGQYLEVEPEDVPIETGEHGKPFLAGGGQNLCFNLSHGGDFLVLAVSGALEVGVDIEPLDADKPLQEMARLVFSRAEQEQLFSLPSADLRTKAFYRCWVRKEACLKACGTGFSLPGNSFEIPCCAEETTSLTVRCNRSYWHLLDIQAPPQYCAALAVASRGPSLPPPNLVWIVSE